MEGTPGACTLDLPKPRVRRLVWAQLQLGAGLDPEFQFWPRFSPDPPVGRPPLGLEFVVHQSCWLGCGGTSRSQVALAWCIEVPASVAECPGAQRQELARNTRMGTSDAALPTAPQGSLEGGCLPCCATLGQGPFARAIQGMDCGAGPGREVHGELVGSLHF